MPTLTYVKTLPIPAEELNSLCFTEIIQWQKRVFIPNSDKAPAILAAVIEILDQFPT
jgi:hypothetical protein